MVEYCVRYLQNIENCFIVCYLQVGSKAMELAVWGAYYNVMTNLPNISDEVYREKVCHLCFKKLTLFMPWTANPALEFNNVSDSR